MKRLTVVAAVLLLAGCTVNTAASPEPAPTKTHTSPAVDTNLMLEAAWSMTNANDHQGMCSAFNGVDHTLAYGIFIKGYAEEPPVSTIAESKQDIPYQEWVSFFDSKC